MGGNLTKGGAGCWWLVLVGMLPWLVGCVDGAVPAPDSVEFTGGWLRVEGGCEQRLVLEGNGRFTFSARISVGGATRLEKVDGAYTASRQSGQAPRLRFTPEGDLPAAALLYCEQWRRRGESQFDLASIIAQTGVAVDQLVLRTEYSKVLGRVTVGTDAARADRFAVYQDPQVGIVGVVLTDPAPVAHPLHHSFLADPNRNLTLVDGVAVVNLPHGAWRDTFAPAIPNATAVQLVLNLASAARVEISAVAVSGLPPCDFSIFSDTGFGTVTSSFVFPSGQLTQSVDFNPGDPGQGFDQRTINSGGVSATAFLVPIEIIAPASGDCAANIRARSLVLATLEAMRDNGDAALAAHPTPGPRARFVEAHAANPGVLMFDALPVAIVRAMVRIQPTVVSPIALVADDDGLPPAFDQLDLLQLGDSETVAIAGDGALGAYLNLFGSSVGGTALGPLRGHERPAAAGSLGLPSTSNLAFAAGEGAQSYSFALTETTRVAIWSEGGLALSGELFDALGRDWGRNEGGAADGAGFQLVATLPAGDYDLTLRLEGAPAPYVLKLAPPAAFPFSDDALGACMIESGWARGAPMTDVNCGGREIAALAGLETLTLMQRLNLGKNDVTDLTPLQAAVDMRELSLDGNRVADLAPLAGLILLERLGLASNPLNAGAPAVLSGLDRLSHLDLRGVPTLTLAQAKQLKQTLVNTLIIAPDGTILE